MPTRTSHTTNLKAVVLLDLDFYKWKYMNVLQIFTSVVLILEGPLCNFQMDRQWDAQTNLAYLGVPIGTISTSPRNIQAPFPNDTGHR